MHAEITLHVGVTLDGISVASLSEKYDVIAVATRLKGALGFIRECSALASAPPVIALVAASADKSTSISDALAASELSGAADMLVTPVDLLDVVAVAIKAVARRRASDDYDRLLLQIERRLRY